MSAISTTIRSLGLAALVALAASPAAHAAIASYDAPNKTFRYTAVNGEKNDVIVQVLGANGVRITDQGANIVSDDSCWRPDPDNWHRVHCEPPEAPKKYRLSLGDKRDVAEARIRGNRQVSIYGGSGDDELKTHSRAKTFLYGEAGADLLLDDNSAGTLSGGDGPDALFGGGGADLIDGGSGVDQLYGQGGNDHLDARDAGAIKDAAINCGPGSDSATVDASEITFSSGCEAVSGLMGLG